MASGQGRPGALLLLLLLALPLPGPSGAWYKHVASPRYHTVGRASGLLMGVRRSPYLWRREEAGPDPRGSSSPDGAPRWLRAPLQPWPDPPPPPATRWARQPCLPPDAAWAGLALQRALRKHTPPDGPREPPPHSIFAPEM